MNYINTKTVLTNGAIGSGKTTIGQALALTVGAEFIEIDKVASKYADIYSSTNQDYKTKERAWGSCP